MLKQAADKRLAYLRPSMWLGIDADSIGGLPLEDYQEIEQATHDSQLEFYKLIKMAVKDAIEEAVVDILGAKKGGGQNGG